MSKTQQSILIDKQLKEGEQIHWQHSTKGKRWKSSSQGKGNGYFFLFLFISLIGIATALYNGYMLEGTLGIALLFPSIFWFILHSLATTHKEGKHILIYKHYVATNQRLFTLHDSKLEDASYHRIKKMRIFGNNLEFDIIDDTPLEPEKVQNLKDVAKLLIKDTMGLKFHLENIPNVENVGNIINRAWAQKCSYSKIHQFLDATASRYKLDYTPIDLLNKRYLFSLDGQIDDLIIKLELAGNSELEYLSINIDCPNPKHEFLSLRPEKGGNVVQKMLGAQDIQIGEASFDAAFLIQADDKSFVEEVLTKELRDKLLKLQQHFSGSFIFGTPKKKMPVKVATKSKTRDHSQVLDLHLTQSKEKATNERLVEFEENKRDMLSYKISFVSPLRMDLIERQVKLAFEACLEMARNISN